MLHPDSHWLTSLLLKELTVWKIAGIHVDPIDYGNVPGCTYASPEIASVGLTENKQKKLKLVNFRSLHREKRLLEHQMVL
jgi:pyruvate/2-oxoglutarate dehydrogenase complex dihydrolipoamide dehydrogenase (E3) component